MITMTEIARLAHVSQPTVSRVLNGSARVSPEIRERVLSCAREHNYQFNALARGLQGGKTGLLGVMVEDLSDSFYASLAQKIEAEARRKGCGVLLLGGNQDGQRRRDSLDAARRYCVDGVLAAPARGTGREWAECARKLDLPVVSVAERAEGLDSFYVDQEKAGLLVASHLTERGYSRFLFIGKEDSGCWAGFRQGLARQGFGERTERLPDEDDRKLTNELEARFRRPSGRTGVFAEDDGCALRVLSALRELGVPVPRRAGVMGFGNAFADQYLSPRLSSVAQPVGQLAEQAVSRLLYRMEHPGEKALEVALEASLAVREST